jgi:uncharacterized protein Yka (UPF0111/DUF47 family)
MKKLLVLIIMICFYLSLLQGVDESVKKKFEKEQVFKAKEVEVVRFEAMKPDIERYQKKTDTNYSAGYYQLFKNNIRSTNKVILNKWLKELK